MWSYQMTRTYIHHNKRDLQTHNTITIETEKLIDE